MTEWGKSTWGNGMGVGVGIGRRRVWVATSSVYSLNVPQVKRPQVPQSSMLNIRLAT